MTEAAPLASRDGALKDVGWPGLVAVLLGVTALVLFTLRPLLWSQNDVLPGTDASNLYAWELYTRAVLTAGRLPHWNPYLFSGTPHFADTQTTVLYPPALLLRWLAPAPYFSWMVALHMTVAGTGAAVLARVIGLGWPAAAAAAVAVSLGGSVPAWVYNGHLLLLWGTSWLPWLMAAAFVSFRRPTVWPHPLLVTLLVLQFLAGYLQGSIYIAAVLGVCCVAFAAWPDRPTSGLARWRPVIQLGVAGALAAGLAAFQLWPTLQLVGAAGRNSGIPYSTAVRGGWSLGDLVTFVLPFSGISAASPMRFIGDHTAYVGCGLVALAPLAFADRRRRRAALLFGVLALGSIAFVMADVFPLYRLHFLLFPGLRIPGRMLFVTTLSVAMLGAIGVDRLLRAIPAARPLASGSLAILLVGIVATDLAAYSHGAAQPTSPRPAPVTARIPPQSGRSLSVCDRAMGPMDLLIAGRAAADGAGGVFLSAYASFQEVARDDGPLRMRRDLMDLSNVTALVSCEPLSAAGMRQVAAADVGVVYRNETAWPRALWFCDTAGVTRREAIENLRVGRYDAHRRLIRRYFVNIRWTAAVDVTTRRGLESRYHLVDGTRLDGNTWRYDLQNRSGANLQALLAEPAVEDTHGIDRQTANLALAVAENADEWLYGTGDCTFGGTVSRLDADRPGGDVSFISDAPVKGMVFLSEPFYPERAAFVDGAPVRASKANIAFTAIPVPAGRHLVHLRYVPRRFHQGLALSAVTLLAWIAIPAARRRRRSGHVNQHPAE